MPDFRLTTPVAFIVFNRPQTTRRVLAEIAKARPPKLLIVGDGPRPDRPSESEAVAAVRGIVDDVDWNCEVLTNFSATNLGCKRRVSSGMDWVFDQVPEAIVLEDDCLPDSTFFRFCQEMLERYREDRRIGMISCANFQSAGGAGASYYFSKYSIIWGWASWRDRWSSYDVSMNEWPVIRDGHRVAELVGDRIESEYWERVFERVHRGEIDTWDYQWFFANWLEGRSSIVPTVNLISNIGYGDGATHTTNADSTLANVPLAPMSFPLVHPAAVVRDRCADEHTYALYFRNSSRRRPLRRAKDRLRRWLGI